MPRNWTQQQQNAIYATDGSVLVSAAAGSGKTAVLVERVIKLITAESSPVDVDRLLIVTFTRDAASEMRERILTALNDLLENDPYNRNLLKQKQMLFNASISTIDSFCGDIVREYFHNLNIDRDFRIADKGELDILTNEALGTVFEYFYKNGGDNFIKLVDAFSNKNGDEKLKETVLKVADFLTTQPFPEKWLDQMLSNYSSCSVVDTIWGKIIIEASHNAVSHAINLTENSIKRLATDDVLYTKWIAKFEEDNAFLITLQKKLLGLSWNEICNYVFSFIPGKLMPPKGYKDNPIKCAVASNRDEVKRTIGLLQSYFGWNEEEILVEIEQLNGIVSTLFELVREYNRVLSELKAKKNILSFADVEQLTVSLLAKSDNDGYTKTPQAKEISSRFDAVMVDEFQDVNDVQDLIFKCVSNNESNLFVVGDVKQSIYGFRQAKPRIFLNRKNQYNKFDNNNPQYPATIILDKNFRSRKEVCDAVNFIFGKLMSKESAGMDYTVDENLNAGADYPASSLCNFEISLIDKSSFDESDSTILEAYYIAEKIHTMISEGFCVKDGDGMRRATYGDFAIIMRSPKNKASKYVNTLINCGIPAYCETNESFFDAVEIKIMLDLLRVIDNPALDISMLSVMCSPIYGFSPDELAMIRTDNRYSSLYTAVKAFSKNHKKSADFISELSTMREYACTCSIDELISRVYEITSFAAISLAVSGNERVVRNLNLLREYARSYENNGYKTLSDFISYIDRMIANGTDISAASANNTAGINSVRVLSVHKSKGLEFPICFIADTALAFNKNDLKKDILIDSQSGLGIRKKSGLVRYDTFPRLAVSVEMGKNEIAEELRVLYVALTRAKEKLIIVSVNKDAEKYLNNLCTKIVFDSIIEPYSVSSCNSVSDWICLCALVHPSLNKLRMSLNSSSPFISSDDSCGEWTFNIINDKNSIFALNDGDLEQDNLLQALSEKSIDKCDYSAILKKNLGFRYKNESILKLPQKVTASDIAHEQNKDYFERVLSVPMFMNKEASTSVQRGTAHHRFLQYCDFKSAKLSIDEEIIRLEKAGLLTAEQTACIEKEKLVCFLKSNLVKRILNSPHILREERFTAKLSPSLIFDEYENISADAPIIIQGAVDLAFEEDGQLVIVDYKTDRVGDIKRLLTLYSKQLILYKEAMQQSTGLSIKECIIYSVHLNEYISF